MLSSPYSFCVLSEACLFGTKPPTLSVFSSGNHRMCAPFVGRTCSIYCVTNVYSVELRIHRRPCFPATQICHSWHVEQLQGKDICQPKLVLPPVYSARIFAEGKRSWNCWQLVPTKSRFRPQRQKGACPDERDQEAKTIKTEVAHTIR